MRLDTSEVEVSPFPTTAVDHLAVPKLAPTLAAAGDAVGGRNVHDDAVLVELEAKNTSPLEGEQNPEYSGGAHGGLGPFSLCRNSESKPLPVRTSWPPFSPTNSLLRSPQPSLPRIRQIQKGQESRKRKHRVSSSFFAELAQKSIVLVKNQPNDQRGVFKDSVYGLAGGRADGIRVAPAVAVRSTGALE
jgi:hypothetical protein